MVGGDQSNAPKYKFPRILPLKPIGVQRETSCDAHPLRDMQWGYRFMQLHFESQGWLAYRRISDAVQYCDPQEKFFNERNPRQIKCKDVYATSDSCHGFWHGRS